MGPAASAAVARKVRRSCFMTNTLSPAAALFELLPAAAGARIVAPGLDGGHDRRLHQDFAVIAEDRLDVLALRPRVQDVLQLFLLMRGKAFGELVYLAVEAPEAGPA